MQRPHKIALMIVFGAGFMQVHNRLRTVRHMSYADQPFPTEPWPSPAFACTTP
jgi:hypothetical protein